MSTQLIQRGTQICAKALNGSCSEYDGFEPSKKCVTNFGAVCNRNKPQICGQCGKFQNNHCVIENTVKASTSACRQAVNRNLFYRSGY